MESSEECVYRAAVAAETVLATTSDVEWIREAVALQPTEIESTSVLVTTLPLADATPLHPDVPLPAVVTTPVTDPLPNAIVAVTRVHPNTEVVRAAATTTTTERRKCVARSLNE